MTLQSSSQSTSFLEDLELSNTPILQNSSIDITQSLLKPNDFLFPAGILKTVDRDNLPLLETPPKRILKDLLTMSSCSLLISFSYFANLTLLIINLHFIGRYNDPILISAIGLGNVWVNCLAINLVVGFNYGF